MQSQFDIQANSVPNLDDWGPDDYWSCEDWICWHQLMVAAYGLTTANQNFINYWQQQSFAASPLDCKSFNHSFRQYAKDNGFFDGLYYGAGNVALPIGWGNDAVSTTSNVFDDLNNVVKNMGSILTYAIPVLMIAFVIILILHGYKNYAK